MKKLITAGLSMLLPGLPLTLLAAGDYDGSKPMMCASIEIVECVPRGGCQPVPAESVDAPRFIEVDVSRNIISARFANGKRSSEIERTESVDGKLMLQGVEDGRETERDGIGWTLSITEERGDMVLTGSGDNVAFVIFGSCTVL
jgi:hypothetical protein